MAAYGQDWLFQKGTYSFLYLLIKCVLRTQPVPGHTTLNQMIRSLFSWSLHHRHVGRGSTKGKKIVTISAMMEIRHGDVKRSGHEGVGLGLQLSGQRRPLWGDGIDVETWRITENQTCDDLEREHVWHMGRASAKAPRWVAALFAHGYCG